MPVQPERQRGISGIFVAIACSYVLTAKAQSSQRVINRRFTQMDADKEKEYHHQDSKSPRTTHEAKIKLATDTHGAA
jgi:hypothetical protein